jgi:hypothetical protein
LINEYEYATPDKKQEAMMKKCESEIATKASLNTWFDPIDPLGRLSATKICETQYNIIDKQSRVSTSTGGVPSLSACVTTSYLTSVKVYCRQFEESDYEDCVNVEAQSAPNQWATKFVIEHPGFLTFDQS